MAPDTDTTRRIRRAKEPSVSVLRREPAGCKLQTPGVTVAVRALSGDSPCFVGMAPGKLDVMGGLSDYSGSLVLSMPAGGQVYVAVQLTADQNFSVVQIAGDGSVVGARWSVPMASFFDGAGVPMAAGVVRERVAPGRIEACFAGVLVELVRARVLHRVPGGLSVAVCCDLHDGCDVGKDSAMAAAMVCAVSAACDRTVEFSDGTLVCHRVETDWLDRPVGISGAACALAGQSHSVGAVRCDPCQSVGVVALSDRFVLVGVDTGARKADAALKYKRVRTASFMGRALIERILSHDFAGAGGWSGNLSQITIEQYVEDIRDRLPTRLMGGEYLHRFGETGDPMTKVDPGHAYRIRSRTEHHIYENVRATDCLEALGRAVTGEDLSAVAKVGELMYASHWSYGQRCGLGGVEADFLVSSLRKLGAGADIYGARTTGQGCGSLVCVFMRNTDRARRALSWTIEAAAEKFGREPVVLNGSASGAMVCGPQRV